MKDGEELKIEVTSAGDQMALISITDTGEGIPEENLDRIFDPFFTTKKGGTGLGLSIYYGITQSHKGEIEVKSNIRELENVIYEAMVLSDSSSVEEKNLPLRLKGTEAEKEGVLFESDRPLNEEIQSITEKIEKKLIKKALREAGGNKTKAAQKLGISRKTLFNKMTQHNIQ